MSGDEIIGKMTLKDKIRLCSGANFWQTKAMPAYGIPALTLSDGPHGLRRQLQDSAADMLGINQSVPATCFPTAAITAASWDPELLEAIGQAIGREAAAQQVDVVLGPGANLKRNPLCGRNFEYFSEDPFLSGKLAAAFIRSVEASGVGSSLKHFACNNQEYSRFNSDSVIDERTLRELYLAGFEIAVREGRPSTVMCAYNKINGIHCSDSPWLLTDVLRTEWGFDGLVVTDWGGLHDRIEGFRAGCDLIMPGGSSYMEKDCAAAVKKGKLDAHAIDCSAARILRQASRAAQLRSGDHVFDAKSHNRLAAEAAARSAVLLKNDGPILPLNPAQRVVLIGAMARQMRYQGAGSSHINPIRLTQPAQAMPELAWIAGCDDLGDTTDMLLNEAAQAAARADVAVVFAGLPERYESEGFDRDDLNMPSGHLRLIDAVAQANRNTVVVLMCGSPVACPWADQVTAILYMGLAGQAGGEAVRQLLYGEANPGGKLAESWPDLYDDCVSSPYYGKTKDALYLEGLYTGYRYYDKAEMPVRWPFGYGLSYTTFAYSDLRIDGNAVSAAITNTGPVPGHEIAQLYIAPPRGGIHRPQKELKGFAHVDLAPGERGEIRFHLDDRSFAVWQDGWKIPGGRYTILVGRSSRDLPLQAPLERDGLSLDVPVWQSGSWYETCRGIPAQADLEAALGRRYVPEIPQKGHYTMDNSVMEMKDASFVMKIVYKAIEATVAKGFKGRKKDDDPDYRMMINASAGAPLRSLQISGGIRGGVFKGLLEMANGHVFRGIGKMLKG